MDFRGVVLKAGLGVGGLWNSSVVLFIKIKAERGVTQSLLIFKMHKSRTSGPKNVAKSIRTFEDAVLSQPYVPVSEEGGQMLFKQRLLRALTCLDINFTLYSYFYLLEVPPKLA